MLLALCVLCGKASLFNAKNAEILKTVRISDLLALYQTSTWQIAESEEQ